MAERLELKYDERGLIPAVVQDVQSGEVLMMAWMNEEALRRTLQTGRATFYSRSRKKLWVKGERSGHVQRVRSVRVDCDGDVVLVRVEQTGGACHMGYRSCFFRELDADGTTRVVSERLFDPDDVYGKSE